MCGRGPNCHRKENVERSSKQNLKAKELDCFRIELDMVMEVMV